MIIELKKAIPILLSLYFIVFNVNEAYNQAIILEPSAERITASELIKLECGFTATEGYALSFKIDTIECPEIPPVLPPLPPFSVYNTPIVDQYNIVVNDHTDFTSLKIVLTLDGIIVKTILDTASYCRPLTFGVDVSDLVSGTYIWKVTSDGVENTFSHNLTSTYVPPPQTIFVIPNPVINKNELVTIIIDDLVQFVPLKIVLTYQGTIVKNIIDDDNYGGINSIDISVSDLVSGSYVLEVDQDGVIKTLTLVIL